MKKENKELDLIELIQTSFNYGKEFIAWLWKNVKRFIRFNIKYIILIGIFTMLGVGLTVYNYLPQNRGLKANFILQLNVDKSYEVADIVKELNLKLNYPLGNPVLAQALNLDTNIAKQIKSFNTYFVCDLNKDKQIDLIDFKGAYAKDTTSSKMTDYICVEVLTFKPIAFESVKQGIVNYLNNTPYLKIENEKRLLSFTERIKGLDYEIIMLDSMRKMDLKSSRPNYQLNVADVDYNRHKNELQTVSLGSSTTTYNEEMFAMQNKRISLEHLLKFNPNAVETYSDGAMIDTAYTIKEKAIRYIGLFYSFGFFLALLWDYRRKIINFLKN